MLLSRRFCGARQMARQFGSAELLQAEFTSAV
jgi:hypothetical protein